jgi:hypothetical protein
MGVGGSFDVLAGFIGSSGVLLRYLTTNAEFIWLASREIVAHRLGRPPAAQGQT